MAKLTRQTMKCFGISAGGADIGVFGSLAAGSPTYSNVISTIQSLAAWGSGWAAETIATNRPALEDMNGMCYVFSYGICYLHEMGIPEYDSGTTYYQYSICQYLGTIYQSQVDSNVGNTPTPGIYWQLLPYVDTISAQTVNGVKTFGTFAITPSGAPSQNYQIANKKYVDDKSAFGSWETKANNTVYQATTDGFIIAYGQTGTHSKAKVYSDGSNPPTTERLNIDDYTSAGSTSGAGCTIPIRKGDYWKVEEAATVLWLPFGA